MSDVIEFISLAEHLRALVAGAADGHVTVPANIIRQAASALERKDLHIERLEASGLAVPIPPRVRPHRSRLGA